MYVSCTMSTRYLLPIVETYKAKLKGAYCEQHAIDRTIAHHQLTSSLRILRVSCLIDFIKAKAEGTKAPIRPLGPAEPGVRP